MVINITGVENVWDENQTVVLIIKGINVLLKKQIQEEANIGPILMKPQKQQPNRVKIPLQH